MQKDDLSKVELPKEWGLRTVSLLGEGSYGKVYRAEDSAGKPWAVKILTLAGPVPETELLSLLKDAPGIVQIQDYKLESMEENKQSRVFIRMECLTDFRSWCRTHTVTEAEAISMMMDLCTALSSCEKAGVLHRDIKPENILVTGEGHCKLCDFGASRLVEARTRDLTLRGSRRYMAPEMCRGQAYDQRADLYSLGLVFYILMNRGRDPFTRQDKQILSAKDREEALKSRLRGEVLPEPADASGEFAEILRKTCAFRPYQRFASADKLRAELAKLQRGSYRKKGSPLAGFSRLQRMLAAAFTLAVAAAGLYEIWAYQPVIDREPCGPRLVCTLRNDGTLLVSGKGAMVVTGESDLGRQNRRVKRLIVEEGVTSIGFNGIERGNEGVLPGLLKVSLPDGLISIQSYAFEVCGKLKKIRIPDTVRSIGNNAFKNCYSLEQVRLPDKLSAISDYMFYNCNELDSISFPETITQIGSGALEGTGWLRHSLKTEKYTVINDILVSYNGTEKKVAIPKDLGIKKIGPEAFYSNDDLEEVELPDDVRVIGEDAFDSCHSLKKVSLSQSLESIGDNAFVDCGNLREISLPAGLERIGARAFDQCGSLEGVMIPDSVNYIGTDAFTDTPWEQSHREEGFLVAGGILLSYTGTEKHVEIPGDLGIVGIAEQAFARQKQLKSVVIPEGVTWIGYNCFGDCENLEEISLPKSLCRIEGGAQAFLGTEWLKNQESAGDFVIVNDILLEYTGADTEEIIIPEELPVTRIADEVFCSQKLKKITIPDRINEISRNAFGYAGSSLPVETISLLEEVRLPDSFSEEEIWEIFRNTAWYYLRD